MRHPTGLDLNGWLDFGCRGWDPEDPDRSVAPTLIDGSYGTVVVEDQMLPAPHHLGGPQAILSPIGRGGGWGTIGRIDKRRSLARHWEDLLAGRPSTTFDADIRAASTSLSVGADSLILSIPDHSAMNERCQQTLLAALTKPRLPRATLLWRPVAVVLDFLDRGILPDVHDGMRLLCVLQGSSGLEVQRLRLRQLEGFPGILAPERAGPGTIVSPSLGIDLQFEHARMAVESTNISQISEIMDAPRLPFDLLFRDTAPADEVVRRPNANWRLLRAPIDFTIEVPNVTDLVDQIGNADTDAVIFLSPLASRHADRIAIAVAAATAGRQLHIAEPSAAARGALFAAQRMERGIPHYLDRLDPIAMAVIRSETPIFADLIPHDAFVPGNREYISEPITDMQWGAGMAEANFYIRKGETEIRHWKTDPIVSPKQPQPIEIRLRQMPAQGWAKLIITSPNWETLQRAPIQLDWASLPIETRTEAEILKALEQSPPTVPERVYYGARREFWTGPSGSQGVLAGLLGLRLDVPTTIKTLTDRFRGPRSVPVGGTTGNKAGWVQALPVSTDGELPDDLDNATREHFNHAVREMSDRLLATVRKGGKPLTNNHLIACLTWMFGQCPEVVALELERALAAHLSGRSHPFLVPARAKSVITHGLGRITTKPERILHVIRLLIEKSPTSDALGALASLLSRPKATPHVLTDRDVDRLAEVARQQLFELWQTEAARRPSNGKKANGPAGYGQKFVYLLTIVAGLVRVRERAPRALVGRTSKPAADLIAVLNNISKHFIEIKLPVGRDVKKLNTLKIVIELLKGNTVSSDVLIQLDTMSGEDNDSEE